MGYENIFTAKRYEVAKFKKCMPQVSANNVARLCNEVANANAVDTGAAAAVNAEAETEAANYARNPHQQHFGVKVNSKSR